MRLIGLPRYSPVNRRVAARTGFRIILAGTIGAASVALVFTGLWLVTALPLGPSDRIVQIFTAAPPLSIEALKGGAMIAALFGFAIGATGEAIYELLRR